jgi:hypothetical protein
VQQSVVVVSTSRRKQFAFSSHAEKKGNRQSPGGYIVDGPRPSLWPRHYIN